jgi:hypothetical protein
MPVGQFTRFSGGQPEEMVAIAKKAKSIWIKHGADDARFVRFHTGAWVGQWLFTVRCSDWAAFAKAQEGISKDAEFQSLWAKVLGMAKLEGRNVVVGYDI